MELYVKFMFSLTLGLVGLSVVFVTLFETIFSDWDPSLEIGTWWHNYTHHRAGVETVLAEDILFELEGRRQGGSARPSARSIVRRREILRDVSEAERRLSSPQTVEIL